MINYYDNGSTCYKSWCIYGQEYTESEHRELLEFGKSIVTRDAAIMNIKHPSKFICMKCQGVLDGRV
jgi:hypothetical protein